MGYECRYGGVSYALPINIGIPYLAAALVSVEEGVEGTGDFRVC